MLKLLLILFLIVYVVYKIGSFFFRAGAATQFRNSGKQRRTFDGNINIDSDPRKTKNGKFKGGEYVDYEEVK